MKSLIDNLRSESFWVRLGFMVLFSIALKLLLPLLMLIIWLQFIYQTVMGKVQEDLYKFISSATQFVYQVYLFLSLQTDNKPYPFADWPAAKAVPQEPVSQDHD